MALVHGSCDKKFEKLKTLLQQLIESGEELGASIAINIDGENVVDIWGGYASESRDTIWEKDTITNVFSTTKTVTALAGLMLIDRGLLDANAKVSQYWPEFAQNGKEDIEVRHILSHTSGVPSWDLPVTLEDVCDLEKSTRMLAEQAPWWKPGTAAAYHSFTIGHLVGELVRRVTGKSLKEFVADEIAGPLHADFQIGVREQDLPRVSDVVLALPKNLENPQPVPDLQPGTISYKVMTNPAFQSSWANSKLWRSADLGGGNGHGNARSVVQMLSAISLGGSVGGKQVLSPRTIDMIFQEQSMGPDLATNEVIRRGIGYGLTGKDTFVDWLPTGRICFWGGYGGSIIIMDLDRRLTISYVMNRLDNVGIGSRRTKIYVKAIYEALGVSS
ncbi:hypothetical protein H2198_000297 [Neophaeococcomyces mojaviensis]|uniref:Uncharacterized protein n=1 Tax=Neophaeococcomyces mojaviensis TaxID=3383035 RepID=A0ACC3AKA2_9EURO|nr:hypothetical protein H2198_000297 [Knufia sp. JES_112]